MQYNNVLGYHAEGEEINYDLINSNSSTIDLNLTYSPNYHDSNDVVADSMSPLGS